MLMYPVLQNRTTWGNDWFILIFILCSRHDLSRFKKKKKMEEDFGAGWVQ